MSLNEDALDTYEDIQKWRAMATLMAFIEKVDQEGTHLLTPEAMKVFQAIQNDDGQGSSTKEIIDAINTHLSHYAPAV